MHPQASFRFAVSERCQFDNFVAAGNVELLARLQALTAEPRFTGTWLFSRSGLGKSHLLQAACQHVAEQLGGSAVYLPLAQVTEPEALQGLDALQLVALDDLDLRLGDESFERALMALYSGLHGAEGALLIATENPPSKIAPMLPDLTSRLRALASYEVQAIDDEGKAQVLRNRAVLRGLPLTDEALRYWLRRGPRDLKRLLEDLDLLIDHALGEQSRISVNTVKQALGL
ncbi:MAG: HdaA/DnaA family protein [Pseudomonadales bacterium]